MQNKQKFIDHLVELMAGSLASESFNADDIDPYIKWHIELLKKTYELVNEDEADELI